MGQLRVVWRFRPEGTRQRDARAVHTIADSGGIYTVGVRGDSPIASRADFNGRHMWTFDSRADIARGHWPALGLDSLVMNDDGFYLLAQDTGKRRFDRGLDTWGAAVSDGERWYLTNTWHVEGPGTFVGAFDAEGKMLWKQRKYGSVKEDVLDEAGGVAVAEGVIVHAGNYRFATFSGTSAFETASGAPLWSATTMPMSDLSIAQGRVFGLEKDQRGQEPRLVARSLATGDVSWAHAAGNARRSAPALFEDLVIVDRGPDGVFAHHVATGRELWSTWLASARSEKTPGSTTLLVAAGSRTLLVVSSEAVDVLDVTDGSTVWSGRPSDLTDMHSPVLVGRRLYLVAGGEVVALGPDAR